MKNTINILLHGNIIITAKNRVEALIESRDAILKLLNSSPLLKKNHFSGVLGLEIMKSTAGKKKNKIKIEDFKYRKGKKWLKKNII